MKHNSLITALLFYCAIFSQRNQRPQSDQFNFVPGEIIVKLKDNVDAKVYYSKSGKAMSDFNIASFLGIDDKVESSKVLFHQKSIEASIVNQKKMKALYAAKKSQNPCKPFNNHIIFIHIF